MHTLIKKHFTV